MQRLYMMRHGQTENNAHKIVTGIRETPLTELGRHQAAVAAEQAKTLNIDLIVCSAMGRAQETAKIIAKKIGYSADTLILKELHERKLGQLEGTSYAKNERLNGNFPAVDHIHGVEPLAQFYSRVQHALRQIVARKEQHILIVCHLGVGRMLRVALHNQKPHAMYDQPRLENATIYPLT